MRKPKSLDYDFDVDKIVSYLKRHADNLPNLYSWDAKTDGLVDLKVLTENEASDLANISRFEREVAVKEKVHRRMHEAHETDQALFDSICLWIIKDWGGIKGAKDLDTLALTKRFLKSDRPEFNRIASSSKIGSYMFPEKYIIYDSRVAYSLNWIILSQQAGTKFFPIPEGRNSKMAAFDMGVLIRLNDMSLYKPEQIEDLDNKQYVNNRDKRKYIPKEAAYSELNKLIKEVNRGLWTGSKADKLFYTEMLLFSIADREVYQDITKRVSVVMS